MSTRLEDMLRSSPPSRTPPDDLHGRIMAGTVGEPGAERVAPSRAARLAPAALGLGAIAVAVAVLSRGPVAPADRVGGPAPDSMVQMTRQVTVIESAMTKTLKDEASLLASDAKRVYEGLKARLPLM